MAARVVRQLRDVGDGLAWRVHHFDRGLITALSDHDSPGPIVHKKGLGNEIGRVIECFRDNGHFALMHDLTCPPPPARPSTSTPAPSWPPRMSPPD